MVKNKGLNAKEERKSTNGTVKNGLIPNRRRDISLGEMRKSRAAERATAVRHGHAVNGPEWGNSEEWDSEDSMDVYQEKERTKRGNNSSKEGASKYRRVVSNAERGSGKVRIEDSELKVIQ